MINIDKLIKQKGLTKSDVAKEMGLSRESVYRILSGNPTLDNLNKLANAIGVNVSELLKEEGDCSTVCPHCGGKIKMEIVLR